MAGREKIFSPAAQLEALPWSAMHAGMNSRIRMVAKPSPKLMLMAIGIRNCACSEVSKMSGSSPQMVVREVRATARRRAQTALTISSL